MPPVEACPVFDWLKKRQAPLSGTDTVAVVPTPIWEEKIESQDEDPVEVGPYRITGVIGEGGMGRVFACDRADAPGQRFALKQLISLDPRHVDRFKREILIGTKLRHPNICSVVDWGRAPGGHYYLLMDLLEGESLESVIDRSAPMPVADMRSYILQILAGLEAVHQAGIVHRDLKPGNIFVTQDGVKIMDFGIATGMGPVVTKTGQVVGTLQFIAPEQLVDSKRVDARADIFNVGLIAFQMLARRLPMEGESLDETLTRLMSEEWTPIADFRSDLPPAVHKWLDGMLQFEPQNRYATAAAVRDAMKF